MGIPKIESYTLKSPEFNVISRVKWKHDNNRSILLLHDMQAYFLDFFYSDLRQELISHCKNLITYARKNNIPIVYTAQRGNMTKKERGLLYDIWGQGMSSKDEHTDIVKELAPQSEDRILAKWRYSAFHTTSLDEIFLEEKRDQIIICGVFAHIGIQTSAVDAYSRDIEVFLVQDAIADFSKQDHLQALIYAAECCATVLPTQKVCK
ncbi:isochorismatase family protein [Xenorhabdus bovienii]|uniref:Isochorismatase family protein n=1 Tax=Xenorhabdus bovienii TaxID=40576 RepID=A0AAJ1N181_XENBV|nr:isochorismatase family protein [Xenorhabdus bovienii]MDE1480460.1 isochorismatase family protein [Xenorhabdus bovienii]MDE1488540.1 isochorismatase family protein [Xenorhabdus bovienii]MDE1492751.1 isochorismatase family protein [Xenorhabdus bovienii]MDE1497183.1 isochorismatase family protein [Xenorhabdus bovienii]MDE9475164.1 isochorismatase family protein [Xenorhabdus bovienii]